MTWSLFGDEELLGGDEAHRLRSIFERSGVPLPFLEPYVHRFLLAHGLIEPKDLARTLANIRVKALSERVEPGPKDTPFPAELAFEERFLLNPKKKPYGIPYDGTLLQTKLRHLLAQAGFHCISRLPVILLPDLLATFDTSDKRYHLRMNVLGYPALISIPGIVLAPAKPRPYYLLKQAGFDTASLDGAFKDTFIGHKDPRIPVVVAGLALQSLVYAQTGRAFCQHQTCSLYNAHWHHELLAIYGALKDFEANPATLPFCPEHKEGVKALDHP